MDDTIARPECNTTTRANEIWQRVVHYNINWLRICCSMAKRLHDKVG